MKELRIVLDKIKAGQALKEKTKKYLRNSLYDVPLDKYQKATFKMRKALLASACSIAVVGLLAYGGFAVYKTPVNYVSIDINPSVELGLNLFDRVVSVEGMNEDGKVVVEGKELFNASLEDAVDTLIQSAQENDYIADDGSTVIAVTAESDDEEKAEEIQDEIEEAANKAINKNRIPAIIYKNCSDLSLRTEAKSMGISPGKLKLIKMVTALDPEASQEELKDAKVSEIMSRVRELMIEYSGAIENGDDQDADEQEENEEIIEELKEIAEKMDERDNNSIKELKRQAQEAKKAAQEQAKQMKKEAKEMLKNKDTMSEEEMLEAEKQAQGLEKQAEELEREAERIAEEKERQAEQRIEQQKKLAEQKAKAQKRTEEKCDEENGNPDKGNSGNDGNSGNNANKGNNGNNGNANSKKNDDGSVKNENNNGKSNQGNG